MHLQYNYCMHLAYTILSPRQYIYSIYQQLSHLSSILCQFRVSYFIQFKHTSTNHVNWLKRLFLNHFSVKTSTHTDITDFFKLCGCASVFTSNIAIIAINSSCSNHMSQIQYRPTLMWAHDFCLLLHIKSFITYAKAIQY